jgi:hypothetical protein
MFGFNVFGSSPKMAPAISVPPTRAEGLASPAAGPATPETGTETTAKRIAISTARAKDDLDIASVLLYMNFNYMNFNDV